jgi:hypothetical protein
MRKILVPAFSLVFALVQSIPAHSQSAGAGGGASCADPLAVLRAFYDSNEARRFAASAQYLSEDVKFDTWATGVNGYMMAQRHLRGKEALRKFLGEARGVRWRLPGSPPDGPVYHETRISVSGATVQFMLEPDRKRPNGKLYNPFSIEAVLDGCRIKTLTVIERVTWL